MNADRWKIGTPRGIGNEEEKLQKEVIQGRKMSKQSIDERNEENNKEKMETRVMNKNGCGTKHMEQRHSTKIRR